MSDSHSSSKIAILAPDAIRKPMGQAMSDAPFEITLRGSSVSTDEAGNVCLNDLWRLAGAPESRRPNDFRAGQRAKAVTAALCKRIADDSGNSSKDLEDSVYYVAGRGRASRTFGHPVLALEYAEYLNPDLAVEVGETFLRYKAKDVTLALEIVEGLTEQAEYDELRVKLRRLLKAHNRMSAGVAQNAGVENFVAYKGAGLNGLYGGLSKAQLLKHKGLPPDAHHLDHAGHEELSANYFKATQAIAKIRREKIKGQSECEDAHREVGQETRQAIKNMGGTMSEDEPALKHINCRSYEGCSSEAGLRDWGCEPNQPCAGASDEHA